MHLADAIREAMRWGKGNNFPLYVSVYSSPPWWLWFLKNKFDAFGIEHAYQATHVIGGRYHVNRVFKSRADAERDRMLQIARFYPRWLVWLYALKHPRMIEVRRRWDRAETVLDTDVPDHWLR